MPSLVAFINNPTSNSVSQHQDDNDDKFDHIDDECDIANFDDGDFDFDKDNDDKN